MDARKYMEEFRRTLARTFFPKSVSPSWLKQRTRERLALAKKLKAARNSLFYGRKSDDPVMENAQGERFRRDPELIHALLGADGEGAELLELIFSTEEGEDLRRRVVEESGDMLYFVALALHSVGSDLEEAMGSNIAKLRERFPDKFSNSRYLAKQQAS